MTNNESSMEDWDEETWVTSIEDWDKKIDVATPDEKNGLLDFNNKKYEIDGL